MLESPTGSFTCLRFMVERHPQLGCLKTLSPAPWPPLSSHLCLSSCLLLTPSQPLLSTLQSLLSPHTWFVVLKCCELETGHKENVVDDSCLPRVVLGDSHRTPSSQRARRCSLHLMSQHSTLPPLDQLPLHAPTQQGCDRCSILYLVSPALSEHRDSSFTLRILVK